MTLEYDGAARPEQTLNSVLNRAANAATNGKHIHMPGEFNFIVAYLKRTQDVLQRAARFVPDFHKSVWGKWKKRRKLSLRERKKEGKYHPSPKPVREAGFAAYQYDEYDDV
jgi:hypothetical protein